MNKLQLTLALIKPDVCVQPHLVQEIRKIILENKFYVVHSQTLRLSRQRAEDFYKEHKGRFFYNRLVNYMSSGPIGAHILAKHDAIAQWRQLMGPTKVFKTIHTEPESIRGRFGLTDTRNGTHGSDSDESARREIGFFFPGFGYDAWYREEEEAFRDGNVKFNPEIFTHIRHSNVTNIPKAS